MIKRGWARVSTREQNLGNQKRRLTAAGATVLYEDTITGVKAQESPMWAEIMADMQPGDALVVTKMDRLGRSSIELNEVAKELKDKGYNLVILDSPIDTTTPHGMLIFQLLAAVAEFERTLIIDRTIDGLETARAARSLRRATGGAPPFGWREPGEGEGDDWARAEPAGSALADAAALVLSGWTVEDAYAAVVKDAAEAGQELWTAGTAIRRDPATGKERGERPRKLTAKMLRAALIRPASAGLIAKARDGENGTVEIIGRAKVDNPPLTEADWRALEGIFAGRRTGRRIDKDKYPLGPVLECGVCGNQMSGTPRYAGPAGNRRVAGYNYKCANPHMIGRNEKGEPVYNEPCRRVAIDTEQVHDLARAAVDEWAATDPGYAAAYAQQAGASAEVPGLAADLAEVDDMLADAAERWYAGGSRERYLSAKRGLETRREAIQSRLAAIAAEAASPLPAEVDWDNTSPALFRKLVGQAFGTLVVAPQPRGKALRASERIPLVKRPAGEAAA